MSHHQLPKSGLCVVRYVESDHFHFRRDALAAAENLIRYGYLELAGLLHPPPEWVKSQTYLWVQGLFYLLSSCFLKPPTTGSNLSTWSILPNSHDIIEFRSSTFTKVRFTMMIMNYHSHQKRRRNFPPLDSFLIIL